MNAKENQPGLDRRDFIKISATATASAAVSVNAKAASPSAKVPGGDGLIHRNERPGMQYRKLGNTNFMSSRLVFGCGAALSGGKAVRLLEQSFEQGINFYDVGSNVYYKGSEAHLAPFLKAHRDDVWVVSKAPVRPVAGHKYGQAIPVADGKQAGKYWTQLMEDSLTALGVDYVDAYYLMAVGDPAYVRSEEIYSAFEKARDAGKVGHFGVSTHKRADEILDAMIDTGWYDLAMIAITPAGWYEWEKKGLREGTKTLTELQPAIQRAREAGIGLVGMKAARYLAGAGQLGKGDDTAFDKYYDAKLMGADLSGFQRSYAYVLENGIDVVNADMQSFEHMEANLQVARTSKEYFA